MFLLTAQYRTFWFQNKPLAPQLAFQHVNFYIFSIWRWITDTDPLTAESGSNPDLEHMHWKLDLYSYFFSFMTCSSCWSWPWSAFSSSGELPSPSSRYILLKRFLYSPSSCWNRTGLFVQTPKNVYRIPIEVLSVSVAMAGSGFGCTETKRQIRNSNNER
jgi:hypothetical protein